ncbi:UNVERIFIED_CONTAM: hypothetical protein Sradi_6040700 [Sesamum radiatum]|uniref:Uncharacterized protein n=1 Tax=Sesamum radiatum TaxID=300843 RepID=A0AAW2KJ00_SESRA
MSNPLMASNRDDPLLLLSGHHPSSASSPIAVSETDSYLLDASQIGSASGSFQNDGFLGGGYDSGLINEAEYGFSRPDFRQGPLVGTVELYERHVFLCYKNLRCGPRIEAAEFDRLPRLLAAALAARKPDMRRQTRLTICEGRDGTETSNGDVLIFPDMIRYRRLTHFDVETFVEEVLVKDGEWLPGSPEALRGWYGYVMPEDVPLLLEQHIGKGEIVDFLWRGQMGLSEEDQKKSQELRFQVNGGSTMDRSMKESAQVNEGSVGICASQVEGTGCCQVNGGFSCCQNSVSQGKRLDPDSTAISTAEKKKSSKKQVSRNNSGKGTGPRKVCSMPTWYENWDVKIHMLHLLLFVLLCRLHLPIDATSSQAKILM